MTPKTPTDASTSAIAPSTAIIVATYAMPTIDSVITLSIGLMLYSGKFASTAAISARAAETNFSGSPAVRSTTVV